MKRLISLLAIVCLCVGLVGCALPFVPHFESEKYLEEFQNNWCYQALGEDLRADYGDLYTAVTDGMRTDETVTVSGEKPVTGNGVAVTLSHPLMTQEEMYRLYTAFTNDNPQFFFLSRHYGIEGYEKNADASYHRMILLYTMDAVERQTALYELEKAGKAVLEQAAGKDAFETELFLHDWLAAHCTYENEDTETLSLYDAYGALVNGRAVCEGYARAMQWLLNKSGMPCTLVNGKDSSGGAHMWNMVTVDGENYHLDVTWDDSDDILRHNYFNLTTSEIEISHTVSTDNIGIPTCTATAANYYRRTGRYIDSYRRHDIAEKIAAAVAAGETTVELRFAEGKYENAALFVKSGNYFFETVEKQLGSPLWTFDLYGEQAEGILMLVKAEKS